MYYLNDAGVFDRGQEAIEVACHESEVSMLKHVQSWLRGELARMEITVESNPSSNLVIGDLVDLEDHPVFRLMPIVRSSGEISIPISINVDNAITFSPCMADEFAHTYYALLRHGVPAGEAQAWLERAREAGWKSRFTLEASTDPDALRQVYSSWP